MRYYPHDRYGGTHRLDRFFFLHRVFSVCGDDDDIGRKMLKFGAFMSIRFPLFLSFHPTNKEKYTMKDFFFGEITNGKALLDEVIPLSRRVPETFFTDQVNRLLSQQKDNTLELRHGTSMPPFPTLLSNIDTNQVGLVEISSRSYPMSPCITSVLTCTLVMPQGRLVIKANWTSYKAIRSDELIHTLLLPLLQHNLHKRTDLVFEDERRHLNSYHTEGMINALHELTGDRLDEQDRMDWYTTLVSQALPVEAAEA